MCYSGGCSYSLIGCVCLGCLVVFVWVCVCVVGVCVCVCLCVCVLCVLCVLCVCCAVPRATLQREHIFPLHPFITRSKHHHTNERRENGFRKVTTHDLFNNTKTTNSCYIHAFKHSSIHAYIHTDIQTYRHTDMMS